MSILKKNLTGMNLIFLKKMRNGLIIIGPQENSSSLLDGPSTGEQFQLISDLVLSSSSGSQVSRSSMLVKQQKKLELN